MVANVGTFAQNELLRLRLLDTQTEINRLQTQVSSGKKSPNFSGLREEARLSISLRATRATSEAYIQTNITTKIRMEQVETVYERIKDIANDVRNASLLTMSPANVAAAKGNSALKAQATAALQEVVQLLNTQIDGFYLFAGRKTDAPPMVDPGAVGTASTPLDNVAGALAVAPLVNTTASGTTAYNNIVAHLDGTAVGVVPGAVPVRYYDGEYSATQESLITARIDASFDLSYGITGRDDSVNRVLQALYALSVSDLSVSTDAGFRQLTELAVNDLQRGFDGIADEIGELGVKMSQLQELTVRQKNFITTLDIQLGEIEDVDMSDAISRFTFAQSALQSSYRMLAATREMSLANIL